jgi:hypothetical protein
VVTLVIRDDRNRGRDLNDKWDTCPIPISPFSIWFSLSSLLPCPLQHVWVFLVPFLSIRCSPTLSPSLCHKCSGPSPLSIVSCSTTHCWKTGNMLLSCVLCFLWPITCSHTCC